MIPARSTPTPSATEERVLGEIAYYQARLADIRRAPESSRHRDALKDVQYRLERSLELLAHLRRRPGPRAW